MQFACLGKGFCISDHALNFHVLCEDFTNGILQKRRSRNAERNLKSARSLSWNFYKAEGEKGLKEAYKIIAQNRSEKGYSLSMDEKTVLKTADCIQTDAFILTEQDKPVASAIVLHLTPDIVQVVYWGDVAQPASVNPMVLFTHYLFDYYSNTDLKIIDTGTAMLDRQANYGLCDFKESIGCEMNPKLTLLWEKL